MSIAGKANVRLLPSPVVSFTNVTVGDPAAPDVEIEQFRAEIDLAPLLKGQIRFIDMTVERPQFHVDIAHLADALAGSDAGRLDPERISLERLQISDGSAAINDGTTGRRWRADKIDAVIEAESLMGPARVTADMIVDGKPIDVSLALGRMADDGIAAKIALHTPDYPLALLLDGKLHLSSAAGAQYDGIATLEGTPPEETETRSPWVDFRASGKFALTPTELTLDETKISYGATERPLILEASGRLDFAGEPRFEVSVSARQIDLDRSLGGGAEKPVSFEAALSVLAQALPRLGLPPIPGELHLDAQGVVLSGGVIQAVGTDLATAPGAWEVESFAAILPGETRVDLKGRLGVDTAPTFVGHARLASRRPPAFAAWWRGETGTAARIGRFSIDADLDFGPENQRLTDLVATTGSGTVKGSVDIRRFSQSDHLFVNVDLAADRADLVEARALAQLLAGKTVEGGRIEQMTVALRADMLSAGGVDARSVVLEGGLDGGEFSLRRLAVADLAGASIEASGNIRDPFKNPSGRVEASISASDFRGAASFLASLVPESRIARHLSAVAPILSPVNAEVSAENGGADGRLALSVTGSFADTHLTLEADGTGSLDDPASLAGKFTLHADGEDSAAVLRQLGLNPLPVRSTPLKVDAEFEGETASAGKLDVSGTIAGVDFDYSAITNLSEDRVGLSGAVKATSADIDPLLLLGGIAVPGVGERHAATATGRLDYSGDSVRLTLDEASFGGEPVGGALAVRFSPDIELSGGLDLRAASVPFLVALATGAEPRLATAGWPDTSFAAALPPDIALDLSVKTESLDLGASEPATDATLDFSLAAGVLNLDLVSAGFAGGTLKGALAATLQNGEAEVSLRGALTGGDLQAFVWENAGLPAASGKLDLSLETNGRGRSLSAVVATLGGSGSFSIDEGRLNALNAEALSAVMAAAEGEKEPEEEAARETFAQLFGSGALTFGRAAGSFSMSDGVATVPTVSSTDGEATILAGARLDLHALTLASDWVVRGKAPGEDSAEPFVEIHFGGPIAEPERRINLDPLLNRMRSRFLQRQLDELEALQAAARQRAEERRQAAAERRDREWRAPPVAPRDPPPSRAREPLPRSLLDAVPLSRPDPASVQVGPDLPPPPPTPGSAPAGHSAARPSPGNARAVAPALPALPASPAPPTPSQAFEDEYRVLPNGTIVKIR